MFYAYPDRPTEIGMTIEPAIQKINQTPNKITPWRALDICGQFIADKIQESISNEDIIIADITRLNFNVTYEIGFGIGLGKSILLTKNKSIRDGDITIREVGIFDTLGFFEYENSNDLYKFILEHKAKPIFEGVTRINTKAPVYLLDSKYKTEVSGRIIARIKKSKLTFRTFDPNESPRLSAYDAIKEVSESLGVVIPLQTSSMHDSLVHNIRAAFIAGLANGMNKATCIIQFGNDPIPIDYRDLAISYTNLDEINFVIADFANKVIEAFQEEPLGGNFTEGNTIKALDMGSSAAENEMRTLQSYYLKTDAYYRASRGEAQLVVGRKGSGKSAIFLQIRDNERSSGDNLVVDLKPEGYKLLKFKEQLLDYLEDGTFQHTIMAFWEYILLLELCQKILEKDKTLHLRRPELFYNYNKLEQLYRSEEYKTDGDFSERMSHLMNKIVEAYSKKFGKTLKERLSTPELTDLLYKNDIKELRENLINYLKQKKRIWLLFDNIDKGWPSTGLKREDLVIIRTLIDAARQLQRAFNKEKIDLFPVVFLRNDVYELLVAQTSDRQKESKVLLDWVDSDLLRQIIKLRIKASLDSSSDEFDQLWRSIIVSHYKGEESSQFLIERSLMRPRFLINLINQCKSFAVNLNHKKIEEEDIEKGLSSYSMDLLTDISYEIRDIFPAAENVLFNFIASRHQLTKDELMQSITNTVTEIEIAEKIVDLLLWYGFLGIRINQDIKYIYDVNYNMQILNGLIQKRNMEVIFEINPGFWPALFIND